jgi:hypothetical protein
LSLPWSPYRTDEKCKDSFMLKEMLSSHQFLLRLK